jgi:uncharacterized protein (TIGR01777 family)
MANGEKIAVTGGTGYLGRALVARLSERGSSVVVLSRSAELPPELSALSGVSGAKWDPHAVGDWAEVLEGTSAVVHLAGRRAVGVRYTKAVKREIFESRVRSTEVVVEAIGRLRDKPRVLLSASGVGYVGGKTEDHAPLDESAPAGEDFLAQLCAEWEARAQGATAFGVRVVSMRFAAVLGPGDGPLKVMSLPFKLMGGGPLGNGRQVFCWISLEDALAALELALTDERLSGPVHVAAPNAVTSNEAARAVGQALHRPSWLPAPAFALRALFGDGAFPLLTGQRAFPGKLTAVGFRFRYPTIAEALAGSSA